MCCNLRYLFRPAFVLVGVTLGAPRLQADERYYILLFGGQTEPRVAKYSHTWATYVKATGEGKDMSKYKVDVRTNSWLPATVHVKVLKMRPEKGVNLDLEKTLQVVMKNGAIVTEWGPYEISKQTYERGIRGIERLEKGELLYRAIDGPLAPNVTNCFHSISDTLFPDEDRLGFPLEANGNGVTMVIVEALFRQGRIVNPEQDNAWLDRRLGLDKRKIVHQKFMPLKK